MDGFELLYKLMILVKEYSTIKDAKKIMEQLTEIKSENLRFKFTFNFDSQMDDDNYFYKCLNYSIEDISSYPVLLVRNFHRSYIHLDLNENIEKIKNQVFKIRKIPINRQKFYLDFDELENNKNLKDVDLYGKKIQLYIENEYKDIIKVKYPNSELKEKKTDLFNTGFELYQEFIGDDYIEKNDLGFNLFYKDKKNNKKYIKFDELLINQGIKNKDVIEIENRNIKTENIYEVNVEENCLKIFTLNVNIYDTVFYFKFLIELKSDRLYDAYNCSLFFNGKSLEKNRDKKLVDINIQKNSTFQLVHRFGKHFLVDCK